VLPDSLAIDVHLSPSSSLASPPLSVQSSVSGIKTPKRPSESIISPSSYGKKIIKMHDFIVRTSQLDTNSIDHQIARYIYSTNSPFSSVEHPEFKKMVSSLRPGYEPPSRHDIAGRLLDSVHETLAEECVSILENQDVCMMLDGWSNVRNEPIVCVCVSNPQTIPVLCVQTINTKGNSHTASYLAELAKDAIYNTELKFKCTVRLVLKIFFIEIITLVSILFAFLGSIICD
jgi:hypothetical protein